MWIDCKLVWIVIENFVLVLPLPDLCSSILLFIF
jgi:hypothetical protein